MTPKFTFGTISLQDIKKHVRLSERMGGAYPWLDTAGVQLSEQERMLTAATVARMRQLPVHLLNAATVWARAVYPLLLLAETETVRAWAEVSLTANYRNFALEGVVDGVLGNSITGRLEAPYVVVTEAKRGIEAQNPTAQVYAQLLAAARLNHNGAGPQEVFGCYTIADAWTFMRAQIDEIDSEQPIMQVETSEEYVAKLEAETIVKILKNFVNQGVK